METIKQIFQEDSGRMSATRVMCFICLINAIVLCYVPAGTLANVSLWIGFAFGSKLIQKPFEKGSPE